MKTLSKFEENCTITILKRNQQTKIQGGFSPLGTKVRDKVEPSTRALESK